MKSITLCFFLLFLTLSLIGQECGTHVHEHDRERISRDFAQFHQNIGNYMPSFSRSNPTTPDIIVIKPHLVVDPATGVTPWGINDAANINTILADANQYFSTINVQFVLDSQDYIADVSLWNVTNNADRANFLPYTNSHPNSINVFFTNNLGTAGGFSSQIPPDIYYYGGPFICLTYSTAMYGNQTLLTHELGHFFGLLHTFYTGDGYERINGSNCLTAGDLICDTPADNFTLNIGSQVNPNNCTYTGTEKQCADNLGLQYNPPVDNIMTYWSTYTCNNVFTPQQYARMNYTKEKYLGYLYKGNDVWAAIEKPNYACNTNHLITYSAKSHNVASYQWSFPGGVPATSTSASPQVTYANGGSYNVTLTVTGTNGSTYTTTENNFATPAETNSVTSASPLDFENNTFGNWITNNNEGSACSDWDIIPVAGVNNNALRLSTIGIKEERTYELKSPYILFQNYAQLKLSFDYAYCHYQSGTTTRHDKLYVYFTSACGGETILLEKSNTTTPPLSTVAAGSSSYYLPAVGDWVHEEVDLISILPAGTDWGSIKILVISGNGNAIYLDNIKLQGQVPNIAFGLEANYNSMFHYSDLVWVDNSQVESGYVVERQDDLGNFYTIATLPPNTTTYSDIGLLPSTTHYYRVRAIINGSSFTPSDSTSIHTFPLPLPPVLTISGSGSQANLSFTIPGQAIGSLTEIYYTANGGGLSQIASLPIIAIGYGHTGLPSNMVHHYAAKHRQGYFSSAFSNQVSYNTGIGSSDQIASLEYFIDNEPGIGNGVAVSINSGQDVSHTFNPNISALSDGFHTIGVRTKTLSNEWSETVYGVFFKTTGGSSTVSDGMVQVEYFINNDPGVGNATSISVTPNPEETYLLNIDLVGISNGLNVLGIRTQDNYGNWSSTAYSTFFKTDNSTATANDIKVVGFEYFIGNEVGVGNGIFVPVSASTDTTYLLNINLSGLSNGLHSIGVRSKDELGNWSSTAYSTFFKTDNSTATANDIKVVGFEYFIGNEVGVGNGVFVPVSASTDATYLLNINLSGLSNGLHSIGVRSKDELGNWSATAINHFMKVEDNTTPSYLTHSEYFVDTDLGIGNGISIGTPVASDATWTFNINTSGLSWGNHTIYVRVQDNFGNWSIAATSDFCYEHATPTYTYNNDNGLVVDFQTYNKATTYQWNFGNGRTSTLQNPTITYTAAGTYNVCVTMFTNCNTLIVCQTIIVTNQPLDVDLISFTGKATENGNLLNWETASETNNKGFSVQRSLNDGKDWQTLGFVDGNGTTTEIHQYEYLDENPALGLNYYRLEQVDFDGTISYSNTIVLKNEKADHIKVKLFPNPTTTNNTITLEIEGEAVGEITYQIIDATNKVWANSMIIHNGNLSQHKIKTPNIAGTYYLKLNNKYQKLQTLTFIVQ
jgi:PKD repeat protein